MSEIPFVRTGYAKTLFERDVPELLKLLREISASLKTIAAASQCDQPARSASTHIDERTAHS